MSASLSKVAIAASKLDLPLARNAIAWKALRRCKEKGPLCGGPFHVGSERRPSEGLVEHFFDFEAVDLGTGRLTRDQFAGLLLPLFALGTALCIDLLRQ